MAATSSTNTPANWRETVAEAGAYGPGAWILLILLLPRLVRLFYPEVWVEDDFYAESAYLVSAGMRPYLDFVHPHPPFLEWMAAAYLRLFGASHFSIEILNEGAIYAASVLVFLLARRVASRAAAVWGAILYATSALVLRYHVYERECFVAALVLGAALLALDKSPGWRRRVALQALALLLGAFVKLTALVPAAVIIAYTVAATRRWREALALAAAIGSGIIAFSAFCYWLYGPEFVFQTFLFHFLKGRDTERIAALYPLEVLDLHVPLFVIGSAALWARRRINAGTGLVLALAGAYYAFFGFLSPTAWGHNYLELLPFMAIISGIGADWIVETAGVAAGGAQKRARVAAFRVAGCGLLLAAALAWPSPIINENWLHGAVYGFGFIPRQEIARLGAALREASLPGDEVIAPSFLCFEANRRELIRFPETYGVWREAERIYAREGFRRARELLGRADFFGLISDTAHFWRDPLKEAIADGKVSAIILDSPIQLVPLVTPSSLLSPNFIQFLLDQGFRPALRSEHFTLWTRKGAGLRDSGRKPVKFPVR